MTSTLALDKSHHPLVTVSVLATCDGKLISSHSTQEGWNASKATLMVKDYWTDSRSEDAEGKKCGDIVVDFNHDASSLLIFKCLKKY